MAGEGPSVYAGPVAQARLRVALRQAREGSAFWRRRLAEAGLAEGSPGGLEDLRRLPVLHKRDLPALQAAAPPFGGLLGVPPESLQRIFASPGPIYDPQGPGEDFWRFAEALRAAGFRAGDVVLNCASYHLTPLGFMFDAGARSLGCVVIPAGVGQQDLQVRVAEECGATAYTGLPSYLLALLERAAEEGRRLRLARAFVTAEPLPPSLRAAIEDRGVAVFQGYGTADLGCVAYECPRREGLHVQEGVVVEIADPETGVPVAWGEVGEVVCTLPDPAYPLLRLGTGDLSAFLPDPCPCGRPSPRLRGWLGRAGDGVKVRGLFVYPRQLEEAMVRVPGVGAWRAVVERDHHHRDRLVVEVERQGEDDDVLKRVAEAVRSATRLAPEVRAVPPGTLPSGGPRLEDRRTWT